MLKEERSKARKGIENKCKGEGNITGKENERNGDKKICK
jgi:hypothetical protein